MDYLDYYLLSRDLRNQANIAAHDRRLRKIAENAKSANFTFASPQDEIEVLKRENLELRSCLRAVIQALIEKGLLQPGEIEQRADALPPEAPPPEASDPPVIEVEKNPFANLDLK